MNGTDPRYRSSHNPRVCSIDSSARCLFALSRVKEYKPARLQSPDFATTDSRKPSSVDRYDSRNPQFPPNSMYSSRYRKVSLLGKKTTNYYVALLVPDKSHASVTLVFVW